MRTAVCFACNEAYFPLCKGLVLSLREVTRHVPADMEFSLHFIDIGCKSASLAWLTEQRVALHTFRREEHPALSGQAYAPRHADALYCRPFLPRIIPGYDCYLWIDSDFWLQSSDVLPTFVRAATDFPDRAAICPELHYGYIGRLDPRGAVAAFRDWYAALYKDSGLAEALCYEPMLNAGLFAMAENNPLWEAWAEELALLYSGDYSAKPYALTFAEQLVFNRILYTQNKYLPLDPLFNYLCGGTAVFRNSRGKVVVGYPPCTPVKGVHLVTFCLSGGMYFAKKLLYREGAYLSEAEVSSLRSLLKH